ncbi:hypothetical protein [Thalassovita sp.]|jgi:hypothetical protein|uniref:hypothetical protein n=1 Tax=Thalassovita sp. TaxID=1979401 RepID=UPI003B59AA1A
MRRFLLLALPWLLSTCMSTDGRHPIQVMLEGRKVVYDLPESTEDWTRPDNMVAESQTWAADGTTVHHRRPLLVDYKTYPKKGRWWIKGDRYCSWFGEGEPPKDMRCYTVRTSDKGTRIHFVPRKELFDIFGNREWHGTYVD